MRNIYRIDRSRYIVSAYLNIVSIDEVAGVAVVSLNWVVDSCHFKFDNIRLFYNTTNIDNY